MDLEAETRPRDAESARCCQSRPVPEESQHVLSMARSMVKFMSSCLVVGHDSVPKGAVC